MNDQEIRAAALQAAVTIMAALTVTEGKDHANPDEGVINYARDYESYIRTGSLSQK